MTKRIRLTNQKMALESVDFKRLPISSSPSKLKLLDEAVNFKIENGTVSFKYKRTICSEPQSSIFISIGFIYSASISEESLEILNQSSEKESGSNNELIIEKIINNTNLCSIASNLISNITMVNTNNPLVTPPMFIGDK